MNFNSKNSNNIDKRALKEKLKNIWNYLNKNWIWINSIVYILLLSIHWIGFFYRVITLEITLLITILYPIIILTFFFIHKSKFEFTFGKILITIIGSLSLGFVIWLVLIYFLITAPWAPLHGIQPKGFYTLLFLLPAYTISIFVIYIVGKRRNW